MAERILFLLLFLTSLASLILYWSVPSLREGEDIYGGISVSAFAAGIAAVSLCALL